MSMDKRCYWCGEFPCVCEPDVDEEPREDQFRDDVEADADALAGAGYGTDEDYGGGDYDPYEDVDMASFED